MTGPSGSEPRAAIDPDGRLLANAINATLYDKLNFNFIRDIAPVAGISREHLVIVVHPSFHRNDLQAVGNPVFQFLKQHILLSQQQRPSAAK